MAPTIVSHSLSEFISTGEDYVFETEYAGGAPPRAPSSFNHLVSQETGERTIKPAMKPYCGNGGFYRDGSKKISPPSRQGAWLIPVISRHRMLFEEFYGIADGQNRLRGVVRDFAAEL
jgi:hypothetical protein